MGTYGLTAAMLLASGAPAAATRPVGGACARGGY